MKFYIAVDCEGPACVVGEPGKGLGSGENYRFACLQATREANAAARALFDAGAQEVVEGRGVGGAEGGFSAHSWFPGDGD